MNNLLLKKTLDCFGFHMNLLFRVVPERTDIMHGVGNRCVGASYVLFLDYDCLPLEWVQDEIEVLQQEFSGVLGNAYFFKTKNGFHIIFLEKHFLGSIKDFMDMTSCDKNYKEVPMHYARKIWVLRQSPKKGEIIKYLGVKKKSSIAEKSLAHGLYMNQYMNVPLADLELRSGKWDKQKEVTMGYYKVAKENN